MRLRGRFFAMAVPLAATAVLAAPHVAHANIVLLNQSVNLPGTPVTETAQVQCSQNSPGTMTISVWLNGAEEVGVTIPWPVNLENSLTIACSTQPLTVGFPAQTDSVLMYINQPYPEPCAVTVGGGCIAWYPVNPATDTLVIQTCQGTSCSTNVLPLDAIIQFSPPPTVPLP